MQPASLITFFGRMRGGPATALVADARLAAALDMVTAAVESAAFQRIVIATDAPDLFAGLPADIVPDPRAGRFHFGERLAAVVSQAKADSVVYVGGGSLPLLTATDLAAIAAGVTSGEAVVVSNNPYSSDLVAWSPAAALHPLAAKVSSDNALARQLAESGLRLTPLPRTAATQFDIDSPADLAVLKLAGAGGPRLRDLLAAAKIDLVPYRRLARALADPQAQLLIAGRVGSHAWQYLERQTACRIRLFSEERGMVADGRQQRQAVRSLLGLYMEKAGIPGSFSVLPELCAAAIIDTRVLLAHFGSEASREDRFLSDLRLPEGIADPFLRELTEAACAAPLPVLLGGHSLVSGGLMLLTEFAWAANAAAGTDVDPPVRTLTRRYGR